eukprot:880643-Prorocentrum_minimum.AAC.3
MDIQSSSRDACPVPPRNPSVLLRGSAKIHPFMPRWTLRVDLNPPTFHFDKVSKQTSADTMVGKDGGKAKPMKSAKKAEKELDDDDLAFKAKQKEEAAKLKALKEQAGKKGTFGGTGLKKSGK